MIGDLIPDDKQKQFLDEVANIINKLSLENLSNTPDWIIASYLLSCLNNWNITNQILHRWKNNE